MRRSLAIILLCALLGSYGCETIQTRNTPIVRQLPDQSLDYIFVTTDVTCHKIADYTRAIKTSGGLAIKTFFSVEGTFESRYENAKQSTPTMNDVQAVFFDICYEYGATRLSRADYEKAYDDYNEIRKRLFGSNDLAPTDQGAILWGDWHVFETEWLEDNPAEGFKAVNPRKDKNEFTIKWAQNGGQVSGKMAQVNSTREWKLSGYFRRPLMVLSYESTNPASLGAGSLILILDDEGDALAGYIIGVECDEGLFMQYPVVLMKHSDRKVAELYFGKHLDQPGRPVLSSRECPKQR